MAVEMTHAKATALVMMCLEEYSTVHAGKRHGDASAIKFSARKYQQS